MPTAKVDSLGRNLLELVNEVRQTIRQARTLLNNKGIVVDSYLTAFRMENPMSLARGEMLMFDFRRMGN